MNVWWFVASEAHVLSPVSGLCVDIMVELNKSGFCSNISVFSGLCAVTQPGDLVRGVEWTLLWLSDLGLDDDTTLEVSVCLLPHKHTLNWCNTTNSIRHTQKHRSTYLIKPCTGSWKVKGKALVDCMMCVCVRGSPPQPGRFEPWGHVVRDYIP